MRKVLPVTVAIVLGVIVLVDFFIPNPQLDAVGSILVEGVSILAAFALLLGLLNLLGVHSRRLTQRQPGAFASLVLMLALLGTFAAGVALPGSGALEWIFEYAYVPLQATMTALLAFFIMAAVFRSFRVSNLQAALLMSTSLLLLIAQLPIVTSAVPQLAALNDWLLRVPVTAGTRGILLGSALGTIATSLRVLMAVDTPYAAE